MIRNSAPSGICESAASRVGFRSMFNWFPASGMCFCVVVFVNFLKIITKYCYLRKNINCVLHERPSPSRGHQSIDVIRCWIIFHVYTSVCLSVCLWRVCDRFCYSSCDGVDPSAFVNTNILSNYEESYKYLFLFVEPVSNGDILPNTRIQPSIYTRARTHTHTHTQKEIEKDGLITHAHMDRHTLHIITRTNCGYTLASVSLSLSHTHTQTHTHTLSLSHTHTHTHTHTYAHTLVYTQTYLNRPHLAKQTKVRTRRTLD